MVSSTSCPAFPEDLAFTAKQRWAVAAGSIQDAAVPELLPLDTFIFDFDGTLVDSMHHALACFNESAHRYGLPQVSPEELPKLRRLGPKDAISEYGVPLWKIPMLVQAVRAGLRSRMQELEPFPGIKDFLHALKTVRKARCLLLTSNSRDNVEAFLARHEIAVFEHLSCGTSMFGKGARLRKLAERARLNPETSAYVGDEVRDIEAARSAGIRSIAVSWGYGDRQALASENPDFLLDEPAQLLALWGK
ncbi:MAG TPA: HAD hydrolase-like protein [Polyangiaceae bacterium]|nr:HAD hydrolase-like protein [Polyangiaceae bacterium]